MSGDVRAEAIKCTNNGLMSALAMNADPLHEIAERIVHDVALHLLAPIRALHRHVPIPPGNGLQCAECRKPWPCPTTEALDAIEGARDE